jgi:dolichol-phosphate mannosyltransferase
MISWFSGVPLHDYGCTLKAYRRDVLEGVRLYGELHRFIPIFARWQGGRITELAVNHHPRRSGVTKYGLNRIIKVILDLMLVRFLTKYHAKPIYVFGYTAFVFFAVAFFAAIYALYLKVFEATSFIQTPLPLLVVLGFMTGMMCILLGLIAEVVVRTYFESQSRTHYIVGSTINC